MGHLDTVLGVEPMKEKVGRLRAGEASRGESSSSSRAAGAVELGAAAARKQQWQQQQRKRVQQPRDIGRDGLQKQTVEISLPSGVVPKSRRLQDICTQIKMNLVSPRGWQ
jgi:hypothetical protein